MDKWAKSIITSVSNSSYFILTVITAGAIPHACIIH